MSENGMKAPPQQDTLYVLRPNPSLRNGDDCVFTPRGETKFLSFEIEEAIPYSKSALDEFTKKGTCVLCTDTEGITYIIPIDGKVIKKMTPEDRELFTS